MITCVDCRHSYPRNAEQRMWERVAETLSVQPRVLCGPCNNGWMSAPEDKTAPVVTSMVTCEHGVKLIESMQQGTAQWALAGGLVRDEVFLASYF